MRLIMRQKKNRGAARKTVQCKHFSPSDNWLHCSLSSLRHTLLVPPSSCRVFPIRASSLDIFLSGSVSETAVAPGLDFSSTMAKKAKVKKSSGCQWVDLAVRVLAMIALAGTGTSGAAVAAMYSSSWRQSRLAALSMSAALRAPTSFPQRATSCFSAASNT